MTSNIPGHPTFNIPAHGYYENKHVPVTTGIFNIQYSLLSAGSGCPNFLSESYQIKDEEANTLFISSRNTTTPLIWYEDSVKKPSRGSPMGRTLSNVQPGSNIEWRLTKKDSVEHEEPAYLHNLTEFKAGDYTILVNGVEALQTTLKTGGVYTILIDEVSTGNYWAQKYTITDPNSMSILWLIPQYVVMTLGEVMFSVTGLEFSYSQAPVTMKSVLQACWLLTVAFGNVIVVIIAEANLFDSQASEFFLFAGLMFVDMVLFMFMAYRYKPNNPNAVAETEPLTAGEEKSQQALEGIDNKALDTKE